VKISKTEMQRIIQEELDSILQEDWIDDLASGVGEIGDEVKYQFRSGARRAKRGAKRAVSKAKETLVNTYKAHFGGSEYEDTGIKNARGDECAANGCGSKEFGLPGGHRNKKCCDKHDVCYCLGGTEANRRKCDADLGKCIGGTEGAIYAAGVNKIGKSHFKYGDDLARARAQPKARRGAVGTAYASGRAAGRRGAGRVARAIPALASLFENSGKVISKSEIQRMIQEEITKILKRRRSTQETV
jgi:hypothetical protein